MIDLESLIGRWRAKQKASDELEGRLRDQIAELADAGLAPDEAFLIAARRLASTDAPSRRHFERWLAPGPGDADTNRADLVAVTGFACATAAAIKAPEIFGLGLEDDSGFYARNISLFALPLLAAYLAWTRRLAAAPALRLLAPPFAVAAVFANAYPYESGSDTEVLTVLHLPLLLWIFVGVAHAGGDWRSHTKRMDYVRFTGQWCIYYTLVALGGGVFGGVTVGVFSALGIDLESFTGLWLLPCGALGAVIVAAWLVNARRRVVENMAPVLAMLFTPLFTAMLLMLLAAMALTATGFDLSRGVLIFFESLLALVLGLLLFTVSDRDPQAPPRLFDYLQTVLVVSAMVLDVLVLGAIIDRVLDFGLTANRVAAVGGNVVAGVNLARSAWLYWGFLHGRRAFSAIERWQTAYLPVYAAWAAAVVIALPLAFGFA